MDLTMIWHRDMNPFHLPQLIHHKEITMAGNLSLKIYGTLSCVSGKTMKKANRVFFKNEKEAIRNGFRPCGHCLRSEYIRWKFNGLVN